MSEVSTIDQNIIIKKIDKETINIQINDNEMLMSIVGQFDQILMLFLGETQLHANVKKRI